jgi:hypothetical protein
MTREERHWLEGYQMGAVEARLVRQERGWAGGKGHTKRWLRIWRDTFHHWRDLEHSQGWVDAMLDSVGC